ncbi:MAG: putative DNA binding domain-containing protein [Parachlamydiaceae bacterium]|nr:putative DNA binding domain-containing protein [Parachlamydiaceae bacterium]
MHSIMIEDYIVQGESKTLEFKENFHAKAKILAITIAFSNTSGGRIIIGIQDKTKHVIGVDNPHKIGEAIANMLHDTVEPRIIPNIEIIPFRNTHLVVIEVYPSSMRPHFERGKGKDLSTYIRIGSTTRRADQELISIIERSVLVSSFDEELCPGTQFDNLDFEYAKELFSSYRSLAQKDLVSLGICRKEREKVTPTVGGILLFSPQRLEFFPDAWIQIGCFGGTDKSEIVATYRLTSYPAQAIDECLNIMKNNMRVGLKIKNIQHEEVWEIPKIALRESIINVVVHTDYSLRGAPIRVSIFTDRIEIENSALLQWGLTINDIKSGVSKLRNQVIGRVFHELGIIEQWGSGIMRMISVCLEYGLPEPIFEEIGARIRITFFKQKTAKMTLDPIDREIIDFIKINEAAATQEIVILTNRSRRSIINRLSRLVDAGLLIEIALSTNDPRKKYKIA